MDILKRIQELRDDRGWTNYRMSEEAKLDNSVVNNMFSRGTMPSIATLKSLCDAFDLTLSQFFNEDESSLILSEDEKNMIIQYRKLNKKNKLVIKTLISGLKK